MTGEEHTLGCEGEGGRGAQGGVCDVDGGVDGWGVVGGGGVDDKGTCGIAEEDEEGEEGPKCRRWKEHGEGEE